MGTMGWHGAARMTRNSRTPPAEPKTDLKTCTRCGGDQTSRMEDSGGEVLEELQGRFTHRQCEVVQDDYQGCDSRSCRSL